MFIRNLLLVSFLVAATNAAPVDPQSLEFVLANLTALWQEVNDLRREVNYHVHDGKIDQDYDLDQALDEVSILAHEHHVHHLRHPHEGHMDHHNADLLQHLEAAHGHGDHGDHGHDHHRHGDHDGHGDHGAHRDHGDSDEYDSEEDTGFSSRGRSGPPGTPDNCGGSGRRGGGRGGMQDNCGDAGRRGGMHRGHGHRQVGHGGGHGGHGGHEGHGRHGDHSHHEHHVHGSSHEEDDSQEDLHDLHGLGDQISAHVHSDSQFYEPDHYQQETPGSGRHDHGHGPPKGVFVDTWEHAYCDLLPNSQLPESHVKGRVDISKREDGKTGVFFDVDVSGFDASQIGGSFGIVVHENPIDHDDHNCDTAGDFLGAAGGDTTGLIGDMIVDDEGEIDHDVTNRDDIAFDDIIGRSIVVNDVGTSTRLACCSIYRSTPVPIRGPGRHHH